jgi:superfamily I DNA/RNA helicase/mRNA-degrading endonuclease RelE of RelBE toxin-antitoxin system
MTTYELSFTPTFFNESLNLPKQVSKLVSQKLKVLAADPHSAHGDAKKLKGYTNAYRARIGDYRIFYSIGQGWVKLLSVRKRDERTYEDDLPTPDLPDTAPDSDALDPQPAQVREQPTPHWDSGSEFRNPGSGFAPGSRIPDPGSRIPDPGSRIPDPQPAALPYPLTNDLLAQWQVPSEYRQAALAAHTEDDLLELEIPEHFISRILDNLFPRPLESIETQPEYVLPAPEHVERFAEEELSSFLLRLSPEQQELARQNRRGPTLVRGGPGTGKSTLALYRVRYLVDQGLDAILFTTYTNALVGYSEQLLSHLLDCAPADCGVKVATVDKLAAHYYARQCGWPRFATEGQALALLATALNEAELPAANAFDRQVRREQLERLGPDFLLQEFLQVIEAWGLNSVEEYRTIERRGRGTPLKAAVREAIWAVYERWRDLMRAEKLAFNEQIRRGALEYTASLVDKPFQALVVDEAQDLSPVALRFLLNLVETPEHVYITADAAQSLYQRGFSWKQVHADLNMTGRSILLKRNYRNTAQIVAACAAVVAGTGACDAESLSQEPAAHQGEPPLICLTDNPADEAAAIRDFFIANARRYRLPAHSGAVLCASNLAGENMAARLEELGLPAVFQKGRDIDITTRRVNVLTIHSAKGLEFPMVAITGLDAGRFPRTGEGYPEEEQQAMENEQRRLFFVGCSRAMRALLVCGSSEAPSPFLDPLQPPAWHRG